MHSTQKSPFLKNIARFNLDARLGKNLFSVPGTSNRMGERIAPKPGASPATIDYRQYRPGDPIKDIDWKLSARTEKTFIKIREGYRQTDFMIMLDNSASMKTTYNNSDPSKFTTALTLAYLVGKIALKSRDRLYLLWHQDKLKIDSENALTENLIQIEKVEQAKNSFDFWESKFDPGANVFVISDFLIENKKFSHFLKNLSQSNQNLFFFSIQDEIEKNFTFKGRYHFLDPESKNFKLNEIDDIKKNYQNLYENHYLSIAKKSKNFGAKFGTILNNRDPFLDFMKVVVV